MVRRIGLVVAVCAAIGVIMFGRAWSKERARDQRCDAAQEELRVSVDKLAAEGGATFDLELSGIAANSRSAADGGTNFHVIGEWFADADAVVYHIVRESGEPLDLAFVNSHIYLRDAGAWIDGSSILEMLPAGSDEARIASATQLASSGDPRGALNALSKASGLLVCGDESGSGDARDYWLESPAEAGGTVLTATIGGDGLPRDVLVTLPLGGTGNYVFADVGESGPPSDLPSS